MALSLLTPTFLFASKNSPAALLLGKGYEKLNWVHRWAGRLLFLMATVHGSLWINNRIRNGQVALLRTGTKEREGQAAYGILCMIVLLSLRPVRVYGYQFFYLSQCVSSIFSGFQESEPNLQRTWIRFVFYHDLLPYPLF